MGKYASLKVRCTDNVELMKSHDMANLQRIRSMALRLALENLKDVWLVSEWGYTLDTVFHETAYIILACKETVSLDAKYVIDGNILVEVHLPNAVSRILNELFLQQQSDLIGAFSLFIPEKGLILNCAVGGKADFSFSLDRNRVVFNLDLSTEHYYSKPAIRFQPPTTIPGSTL